MLAETAHNAGVITNEEFAIFQNAGYMGLYGGLDVDDIESLLQDVSNKICYSCKYHHTVAIGACDLYWNSMLCERLDGRTGILLRKDGRPSKTRLSVLWMKRNYIKILFLTFQQNLQCSILNYPFARRHSMFF